METAQQISIFKDFIEHNYYDALLENVAAGRMFLPIEFSKLSKFDPFLADMLLDQPEEILAAAQQAIGQFDIDPEISKKIKIRIFDLSRKEKIFIRDVRSKHIGKLLVLEGSVRQKSDVRPQVISAKFECPSCGTTIEVLQTGQKFQEPAKCRSCGRKGRFHMLAKQLVDAQGIVLEEATSDLEGGEQPKRINVYLRDDLVSPITEKKTNPGTSIRVVGVVREIAKTGRDGGKLTKFDLLFEANSIEPLEEDYLDVVISPEEEGKIIELSKDPEIYQNLIDSIAPGIYGHDQVKEAILLQFLGGCMKLRADGVKNRGDVHVLLIGDPGSGKCLSGDTKIMLQNGDILPIKDIASDGIKKTQIPLPTLGLNGTIAEGKAVASWKRSTNEKLLEIHTQTGKIVKVTKNHPLFYCSNGYIIAKDAEDFKVGERLASPRKVHVDGSLQVIPEYKPKKYSNNSKAYRYPSVINVSIARMLGYLCGDGCLRYTSTSGYVGLTNADSSILSDFNQLMKQTFGCKLSSRKKSGQSAYEYYVTSKGIYQFFEKHFPTIAKKAIDKNIPNKILRSSDDILSSFIKGLFDCDSHVNTNKRQIEFCSISQELASTLHSALLRFGIVSYLKKKKKYAANTELKRIVNAYEIIIPSGFLNIYQKHIGYTSKGKLKALNSITGVVKNNTNVDLIPNINSMLKSIRLNLNLTQSEMGITRSSYAHYEQNNRLPSHDTAKKIVQHLETIAPDVAKHLKQIVNADIFWDKIISINEINSDGYVYDLEVDSTHNYVANGVVVHNSQLLKRASVFAPKSKFVSGKGASGAGLTAAVVRDEFMNGWALEAGALVLANHGICLIDELDKMTVEDQSAMHEALEQQTVSISKANIQATLRCETTVLAAANPKLGRFDPYEDIARQINLPPALINRFDLIFPVRDIPDRKRDEIMAGFILNLHKKSDKIAGKIDTDMLRRYIVYSRQTCRPELSDSSVEAIKEFYVNMRNSTQTEGGVSSIPISPRQLEALIRLTEASAKVRLAKKTTKQDAKVAIALLEYCLNQIGIDPETGKIDIDKFSGRVPSSQRSKIINIREIIKELEEKVGKTIPVEEIYDAASQKGIDSDKVEEALTKLKLSGDIFEPKRNFISRI
jgi:replicative DNA helicase Mcm